MTVPQAKGLEFDDVFLFNFFDDSPADAAEWRVLNDFVEDLKTSVEESSEGGNVSGTQPTTHALPHYRSPCVTAHVTHNAVRTLDV